LSRNLEKKNLLLGAMINFPIADPGGGSINLLSLTAVGLTTFLGFPGTNFLKSFY